MACTPMIFDYPDRQKDVDPRTGTNIGVTTAFENKVHILYKAEQWKHSCACLVPELIATRKYTYLMENRMETNRPTNCGCLGPCAANAFDSCCGGVCNEVSCWPCLDCCIADNVNVTYFDRGIFAPACCGLCPGTFFTYEPKCCGWCCLPFTDLCYLSICRPMCGEHLYYSPCDNTCCKCCCGCRVVSNLADARKFANELNGAIQNYRQRRGNAAAMETFKQQLAAGPTQQIMVVQTAGQVMAAPQQQFAAPQQQYAAPQQQYASPQQQYAPVYPSAPVDMQQQAPQQGME